MPFIKMALDAKEPVVAPEAEYDLRIFKVEEKKTGDKSKRPGEPMLLVMINIEEPGESYAPVFHNLMLLTSNTPEEHQQLYKLGVQRFLACFNISGDHGGFDTDDFVGATGRCLVVQGEDDKGEPRNELKLPRLDEEGDEKEPLALDAKPRGRRRSAEAA